MVWCVGISLPTLVCSLVYNLMLFEHNHVRNEHSLSLTPVRL